MGSNPTSNPLRPAFGPAASRTLDVMIEKAVWVACNFCTKPHGDDFHDDAATARRWAADDNWRYVKGQDICPECWSGKKRPD